MLRIRVGGFEPPTSTPPEECKVRYWLVPVGTGDFFRTIDLPVPTSAIQYGHKSATISRINGPLLGEHCSHGRLLIKARLPITPISFPFAHHTMPFIKTKAYLDAFKLPFFRLPGFQKIKNNDVVVFNWPDERMDRPIDKKENYIKTKHL